MSARGTNAGATERHVVRDSLVGSLAVLLAFTVALGCDDVVHLGSPQPVQGAPASDGAVGSGGAGDPADGATDSGAPGDSAGADSDASGDASVSDVVPGDAIGEAQSSDAPPALEVGAEAAGDAPADGG